MSTPHSDALSVELLERSQVIVELDGPQIEAWASDLLNAWDDDGEALAFVGYCRSAGGPAAALICHALGHIAPDTIAKAAAAAATDIDATLDDSAVLFEPSEPMSAWQVSARFGRSIIVGCGSGETADHSLLVEIDQDGLLADLRIAGPPLDLLPTADDDDERSAGRDWFEVEELAPAQAALLIGEAWRAASREPRPFDESVPANEQFVRSRLALLIGEALPALLVEEPDLDPQRGMTDAEFHEANRAARSTLQAALGDPPAAGGGGDAERVWIDVIRGSVVATTAREAQALLYLEWADWLGAGIGLVRSGPGTEVDGQAMVDLVNRCPEVSSTIDAADRKYIASCFDLALEHLAAGGLVVDGQLSAEGHRTLPGAMFAAWQ